MANQVIIDETRNQISVIEGQTRIIEVAAQGPQGPVGPRGEAGPSGSSILNQITSGSVTASVDIGSAAFTVTRESNNLLYVSSSGNVGIGVTNPNAKLHISGSTILAGNTTITGSLLVTGNITAQTLVVQTITSSVLYSSGSNIFGNSLTNTQQFTGSVTVTGSLSVNGGVVSTGNGTSGQVAYWTGTSAQTGSNNLFWDNTNGRLGIGTNTPTRLLHINQSIDNNIGALISNLNVSGLAQSSMQLQSDAGTFSLNVYSTINSTF